MNLKENPFYLDEKQIKWVNETLSSMSIEEKIGQLLCPCLQTFDESYISHLVNDIKIGAVMVRPFPLSGLKNNIENLQQKSRIPLLVAANLENGGKGAINEGTLFANPLAVSASNNLENAYRLGLICAKEASAVGINWSFAPIVDIDFNYHNPITNVRTFGSDKEKVLSCAREYIKAMNEYHMAYSIKHFPGDGVDERDQHLLVSNNSLSNDEWLNSYGYIYENLIKEGAKTVMIGHISANNVSKSINPDISFEESLLPASQSKTLVDGLLRDRLGFNGLAITDSTLMVGYMQMMPRRMALPNSIASGIDMILFNRSIDEDYKYLLDGYEKGIITLDRLNEAVTRILATKISLKANVVSEEVINCNLHQKWSKQVSDESITLVKDNCNLLPINPKKTKRIYLNVIENQVDNKSKFAKDIKKRLEKLGFEVTLRKRKFAEITPKMLFEGKISKEAMETLNEISQGTDDFVNRYDLCMIVLNMETASNHTVVRVDWKVILGLGNDIPWYAGELPMLVISTANPYHLLDIPMADAYINTYTNSKTVLDCLFKKLIGKSSFKGVSPVDAFCSHIDTRL